MNLLSADGYIIVNRALAKAIGINAAILLYELIKQHNYYEERNQLTTIESVCGFFYETIEHMQTWTSLSRYEQDSALKKLRELGFVTQVVKGIPAKRYFRIEEDCLQEYFSNSHSSFGKSPKLDCKKLTNLNVRNSQTAPYIEKEKKEKEKKQLPGEAPDVVVASNLDKLKIPQNLKKSILKKYSIPEIDIAVERCLKWEKRTSDSAAINTCLEKASDWVDIERPEDIEAKNLAYLATLKRFDGKSIAGRTCCIGSTYVELNYVNSCIRYETSSKTFIEDVRKALNDRS